jgi:hypothetical protein
VLFATVLPLVCSQSQRLARRFNSTFPAILRCTSRTSLRTLRQHGTRWHMGRVGDAMDAVRWVQTSRCSTVTHTPSFPFLSPLRPLPDPPYQPCSCWALNPRAGQRTTPRPGWTARRCWLWWMLWMRIAVWIPPTEQPLPWAIFWFVCCPLVAWCPSTAPPLPAMPLQWWALGPGVTLSATVALWSPPTRPWPLLSGPPLTVPTSLTTTHFCGARWRPPKRRQARHPSEAPPTPWLSRPHKLQWRWACPLVCTLTP